MSAFLWTLASALSNMRSFCYNLLQQKLYKNISTVKYNL